MHNNLGSGAEDIGLVYMAARWYAPALGRFISADTLIPNPANPQSYNRYSYVGNRVLNATDPTGHRECDLETGDCSDGGPYTPPPSLLPSSFPPILQGLPLEGETWKTATYHNGFGANNYAETHQAQGAYSNSGGIHPGIDFIIPSGTTVFSNVSGTVVDKFPGDGSPNVVVKVEADGDIYYVVYGHIVATVRVGDEVKPGDVLGTVWLYMVTNPDGSQLDNSHLHLAVRQELSDGQRAYNPINFFADPTVLDGILWNGYAEGEDLYSIESYLYTSEHNFWSDGETAIGVVRP